ncbi:VOC family protein [Ekhidna sp.]|uniref:VOC family protein n=1 Tax=Ekhidna sp. TaxID=2608089 RepID=UPI003299A78E
MKKIFTLAILCTSYLGYAQEKPELTLDAYFSAIIVADIDSSINWYSTVLGFEIQNRVDSEERGFRQSNLNRNGILLELIQLDRAVQPKDVLPNFTKKTRMNGFFKIGFKVSDFEKWIDHLEKSKASFSGNIVSDPLTGKKMIIITDPDGNRIQIFEK